MPDPAITVDRLEPLQIALRFPAQIALDRDFVVRDRVNDLVDLLRRKVFRAQVRIDVRLFEDPLRSRRSNPVNVSQRRFDAFIGWYFNSQKSWHKFLSLALFVTRVAANHVQLALPPNQLAVLTNPFHTGANFHDAL